VQVFSSSWGKWVNIAMSQSRLDQAMDGLRKAVLAL